ncbi:hypothetical protein LWF01_13040 [Saxibacter everestensis]|uniref:Uncharacterized protein n=1 Tax=Saxibacter everestensis TaxID=2909229 RepID=A0ABY8QPX1_9MICO|nr:hypothetical protein LWF01_13040 [Brevibacteriaceae bacterium ZFBP1038]
METFTDIATGLGVIVGTAGLYAFALFTLAFIIGGAVLLPIWNIQSDRREDALRNQQPGSRGLFRRAHG